MLFMALVGFSPSVVRAGVTMLLFYAAKWMGEKEDSLTSLGFAALLLCLFNPYTYIYVWGCFFPFLQH